MKDDKLVCDIPQIPEKHGGKKVVYSTDNELDKMLVEPGGYFADPSHVRQCIERHDSAGIAIPDVTGAVLQDSGAFVEVLQGANRSTSIRFDIFDAKGLTLEKVYDQNKGKYRATSTGKATVSSEPAMWLQYSATKDVDRRFYFVVYKGKVLRITMDWVKAQKPVTKVRPPEYTGNILLGRKPRVDFAEGDPLKLYTLSYYKEAVTPPAGFLEDDTYISLLDRIKQGREDIMTEMVPIYRKAGKRDQAIAAYRRVAREFADHAAIAEPSREQLAALGVSARAERDNALARIRVLAFEQRDDVGPARRHGRLPEPAANRSARRDARCATGSGASTVPGRAARTRPAACRSPCGESCLRGWL